MWLAVGALGFALGVSGGSIAAALAVSGIFLVGTALTGFLYGGVLVLLMKFIAQRPIALSPAIAVAAMSIIVEFCAVVIATAVLYPPSPTAPPSNIAVPLWVSMAVGCPALCACLFILLKFRVHLSAARSAAVALIFTIINVALMVLVHPAMR